MSRERDTERRGYGRRAKRKLEARRARRRADREVAEAWGLLLAAEACARLGLPSESERLAERDR
jgi:hypothetical protein